MWNSRPPPPSWKKILNFHFDYLNPSLNRKGGSYPCQDIICGFDIQHSEPNYLYLIPLPCSINHKKSSIREAAGLVGAVSLSL